MTTTTSTHVPVLTPLVAILAALCAFAALPSHASEYTVSPMRMELDRDARSTAVTLTNTGSDRIEFQLRSMEWTQDAEGKDRYDETAEIVFFPKILSLAPSESRVVRVGVRAIPATTERTFRLFVEKIPSPNPEPLPAGANVAVNIRFALPIFVKPPVHRPQGEIAAAALAGGEFALVLKNVGNEHFRMDDGITLTGRNAQGAEVFAQKFDDRYLLAGATKRYTVAIPKSACAQLATLEIAAKSEQFTLSRRLDVSRTGCE